MAVHFLPVSLTVESSGSSEGPMEVDVCLHPEMLWRLHAVGER